MDESEARVGDVVVGVVAEVPSERVDECAVEVAVSGMDDHSGGFVDDKHLLIFVNDVEGDVLRDDFVLVAWAVHDDADEVARVYAIVAFDGFTVDADAGGVGGVLDAVAGGAGDALDEVFVDAEQYLAGLNLVAVMLPVVSAVFGEVRLGKV